jgi:phage shock protein A
MPGLEGRFSTLVKAKVSAVLDRAEDPAETLDYSYEKQLELLQQAKSGIVDVVTSKKRLQSQEGALREQAAKLDGQARQALAAGNEDLSRQALTRRCRFPRRPQALANRWLMSAWRCSGRWIRPRT